MSIDIKSYLLGKNAASTGDITLNPLFVTENGSYVPGEGKAFGKVNVAVPQGVFPSGTKTINRNGEYNVTEYEKVDVNIKPTYSVEGNTLKISGMVESGVLYL